MTESRPTPAMLPPAVLVADYVATIDLLDRTELRLRTTQELAAPGGFATDEAVDLGLDFFTQPTIRLGLLDRRWAFDFSYSPAFTFPDLELGFTPVILNSGTARAGWHDRDVTIALSENVSYGQVNGAYVVPTAAQQPTAGQPPIVQAVPAPTTIDYLASTSTGSLGVQLDRRNRITASAEYDVTGGTNAASRVTMPEQYGPRANATYEYLATRRDALLTTALFRSVDFLGLQCLPPDGNANALYSCSPQNRIFQAGEALRHRITRMASIAVGAGFAASVSRLQTYDPFQTSFYPTGEALLSFDFDRPSAEAYGFPPSSGSAPPIVASSLRISGHLSPLVDIRTGNVFNATGAEASLVVPASMRVAFLASGGFLQYLPTGSVGAVSLVHTEAEIDFALDPYISFALGERGIWQEQNGFGTFLSSYGFLAVTLREPRLTF